MLASLDVAAFWQASALLWRSTALVQLADNQGAGGADGGSQGEVQGARIR